MQCCSVANNLLSGSHALFQARHQASLSTGQSFTLEHPEHASCSVTALLLSGVVVKCLLTEVHTEADFFMAYTCAALIIQCDYPSPL